MAANSASVTLDRAYFDTLLRRAQFHPESGNDHGTPANLKMVTIKKSDYDALLKASREYANLRKALFRGNIDEATLAVLVQGDDNDAAPPQTPSGQSTIADTTTSEGFFTQERHTNDSLYTKTPRQQPNGDARKKNNGHAKKHTAHTHTDTQTVTDSQNASYYASDADSYYDDNGYGGNGYPGTGQFYDQGGYFVQEQYVQPQPEIPVLLRSAQRTLNFSNLDKATTYVDITAAISGGPLIDVFLRANERTVNVSFIHPEDAAAFFAHVKRNDLYILSKRVHVKWAERHFFVQGHIANQIMNNGATRCLIIRGAAPKHTEKSMRDDMEHIHNAIVIRVDWEGGDARLEFNSVNCAMFAKTCMMSRAKYKGCKIEWGADPCDIDVPVKQNKAALAPTENKQRKASVPINRFACLNVDDGDEGSDADTEKGEGQVNGVKI